MRIESEIKLGFKDVLIRPKRSTIKSRSEVSLMRNFKFKYSGLQWSGVPLIASNMDTIGTFPMAKALSQFKIITAVHKHYEKSEWLDSLTEQDSSLASMIMISCGILDRDFEKLKIVLDDCRQLQFICIDVANGYTEYFVDFVKKIRDLYPTKTIVAGNVVTPEMTEELIISGADIVKVGIGPGSVCTTRVKTGVGYPQLSAIIECADAAHGLKGHVISDGGCVCGGDVVKAFSAGADFVMLGGMLSGHDEGGGEELIVDGKKFRKFYGMSSDAAMKKHSGGVAEYRASEGKSVLVSYKGSVIDTVKDILGGVRSACTYVGARELKELSKRTTFIRTCEQENKIFSN